VILYQLAQWMEERSSLQKALRYGSDDVSLLQGRIDEVERQLQDQANRWRDSIVAASSVTYAYEAPHLDSDAGL
jgi:hypothetical protein